LLPTSSAVRSQTRRPFARRGRQSSRFTRAFERQVAQLGGELSGCCGRGADVDQRLAGADSLGEPDRAVGAGEPDADGKAVLGRVGDADRIVLVLVRNARRLVLKPRPSSPKSPPEMTIGQEEISARCW
jgi:hypothetical protein